MAVSGKKKSRKSPAPGGKVSGKTVSAGNGSGVRPRLKDDISAIVSIALGAFLIFALFVAAAGKVGAGISALLKGCFGAIAFILPFALIAYGIRLFARQRERRGWRSAVLVGLIFFMALLLESAFFLNADSVLPGSADFTEIFRLSADGKSGGVVGMYAGAFLTNFIGKAGLCIFSVVVLLVSALLLFNTPLSPYFHTLRERRIDAKARKAAERESAEAVRENEAEDLDPRAPDGSDTRDGAPDGRKTKSSVFSRKLSRNQINILDAVKNDDLHVTGSETAPQTAADAGSATEPVPETDAVSETEDAAGTGFGLEPPFRGGPGLGLDGGDEQAWAPVYQFRSGGNSGWADEDGDPAASAAPEGADAVRADPRGNATDALIAGKAEPVSAIGFGAGDAKDRFLPSPALGHYTFPPVDLLNRGPKIIRTENAQELKFKARKLEQTLRDFKVDATVIRVTVGPTVTRYEVKPDVGVKIQSIKSLEPDLALKLEVKSVRVVPMPGQAVIGIEAYNANTNLVTLREIIDSPEFRSEASKIAFVLGKNISGERIIADLYD
ncbi:MAG: DNA translocase FtsK 4TM domain-containing protein, partial [Clostridiales Family XIII bacterium]|nr:DNA translocase FtsK 4TM domain-containing protein [Clostridiales Family XIII bacterium]